MLTGGRVLHYLKEWLPSRKNTVLLVGYQAEGTRGRAIKSGSSEVKIFGEFIPVNCNVEEVNSLSAHADQNELLAWVGNLKNKPDKLFIVHGDPSSSHAFKLKLESKLGISSITPHLNQEEVLFNL
jgi:metallo-beta-lactamase family protein